MPLRSHTFSEWVIDQFSYFAHKIAWRQPTTRSFESPGWVPERDARRIRAYALLQAYFVNSARWWLAEDAPSDEVHNRREYGDVKLLVEQTLTSLIGSSQTILVEDAIEQENAETSAEAVQQQLLETWAEMELWPLKNIESERQSIKFGDSIMVIYWNEKKQRPCLTVYDPGFYFPYFDPFTNSGQEDFPDKVNICWEFEDDSDPQKVRRYVRRLQWFLAPYDDGHEEQLPWNDAPTTDTCWFSDGFWEMEGIGKDPNLFDERKATWISDDGNGEHVVDLAVDFIPVVHVPNDISLQDHYGTALISHVLQLLDEIQSTDTDISRAAATAGSPAIAISGAALQKDENDEVRGYGPGQVLEMGDGSATVIDTSSGLKSLLELKDALLERLSVNIRLPEALLGRVKPNEVPSGIAITLSFTPHTGLINEMRKVRKHKNGLVLKFVSRFYMLHDQLTEIHKAEYVYGSFLPADKQETMTLVVQLYTSKAISLETAVKMLIDAGYPIISVVEEIERIMSRDVAFANQIGSMGDINEGRQVLGLPALTPEEEDQFNNPPAPGE